MCVCVMFLFMFLFSSYFLSMPPQDLTAWGMPTKIHVSTNL